MEIWKEIAGYNGMYEVSNIGRVRSFYKRGPSSVVPNILAQGNLRGYRFVNLPRLDREGRYCPLVHQLVAKTFIGEPPEGIKRPTVNHLDYDKANNRVENLAWTSQADNCTYSKDVIPRNRGEANHSKLTEGQAREIRKRWLARNELAKKRKEIISLWKQRDTLTGLAEEFGVSLQTCSAIFKRKKWKHIE